MKRFFEKWRPSKRKLMQLYFALLYNANLKGFGTGTLFKGATKAFCVPGLNCYSCPGAVAACPLGSLQGTFSAGHSTFFYVAGILLLYGFLFGRLICGWLCPFGLIQELLHKIPGPKLKKSPVTRVLSFFKYGFLVLFVLVIPLLYAIRDVPLPAFCKYICPAGTLEGGLTLLSSAIGDSLLPLLGSLFTWKCLLTVSILTGCIFIFRLFCRFICPLGALYGLFHRISLFGVRVEQEQCVDCGKCVSHCKLDIRHVGDPECIACGECVDLCPTGAIRFKGGKLLLKENEGQSPHKSRTLIRALTVGLMLAVLVVLIVWCRVDAPLTGSQGNRVGNLCQGEALEVITAQGLSPELIDPVQTGKITVINFWGTWCSPCVRELPAFDRIAAEYPVSVFAIHTHMVWDTAPEFIAQYYPESSIVFLKDRGENNRELYYDASGGQGTYPYTLILDAQGIIRFQFSDPLTYEELRQAIESLLAP